MVRETRPNSEMSVTFVAGYANAGERARGAHRTIATCLVTDMVSISPTTFMACITYVSFGHCHSEVSYHVIMSFNFVVE